MWDSAEMNTGVASWEMRTVRQEQHRLPNLRFCIDMVSCERRSHSCLGNLHHVSRVGRRLHLVLYSAAFIFSTFASELPQLPTPFPLTQAG
jgi:hypothetical protein